jgi:hypothetical protein
MILLMICCYFRIVQALNFIMFIYLSRNGQTHFGDGEPLSSRPNISLVFCVMFWRSLFVFFSFFFWPLCCLSCLDLRILITPSVSSNSSYYHACTLLIYKNRCWTHVLRKENQFLLHQWHPLRYSSFISGPCDKSISSQPSKINLTCACYIFFYYLWTTCSIIFPNK